MTMTVEVRVRRLAALGNDAIGAGLMTTAFGPGGRLTGPLGGESRAGRDPGTVRWRACGTSQPAWSPPGGRRRGGRGGRSGAGSEPSHPNPRSRPGSSRGGRLKCPASLSIVYGLRRAVHSSTDNSQIPRSRAREGPAVDLASQPHTATARARRARAQPVTVGYDGAALLARPGMRAWNRSFRPV